MKKILASIIFLIAFNYVGATHIIGGDFTVQHISDSTFEVTLTLFRDCGGAGAPLDPTIHVSAYEEGTDVPRPELDIDMTLNDAVFPTLGDNCFTPGICLEIGTYITTITLPDFETGYYFTWERCCRNPSITNIVDPMDAGMVFLVTVADPSIDNSTPIFQPYPTDGYLCINGTNAIDFSATDVDGDSLVYRLETPLQGELSGDGDIGNPVPAPNLGGPKPHLECSWLAPYDLTNICDGTPPMSIDSETGILTANPDDIGFYVLAIAIDEYRDGNLISTIRREIQLESTLCALPVPPQFVNFEPIDTIQVYPIVDNLVNIVVEATGSNINASVSGDIILQGFEPLAYIDTIGSGDNQLTLQFEWDSIPCDFVGDVFLLEFYAEAFSDCLDTILTNTLDLYVEIVVDPNVATNYLLPVVDSYDIVFGQNDTYGFPVIVNDGNPTDTLSLSMLSDINGTNPIVFEGDTANNLVSSDFSWVITCDDIRDEPYNVTFQTVTTYCEVQDTTLFNMDLNVIFPTDDPTVIVSPDSIMLYDINGEERCFNVRAEDGNNIDTLTLFVDRNTYPFSAQNMATFSDTSSIFVVESEFCWTPQCDEIDPGIYNIDFTVVTKNCEIIQETQKRVTINLFPTTDGEPDTIPNVFTPNGDVFNETYRIAYTPEYCISDYNLSIFNRWGNVIFQTQNRDQHWDGKNNGNDVAEGVYYVILTYKYYDEPKEYTESIHLFR
ncbi:MAG: gliding motility-associated-like protein [Patiriisocius sp.]|jgi:gliding motility-associated-like protein